MAIIVYVHVPGFVKILEGNKYLQNFSLKYS